MFLYTHTVFNCCTAGRIDCCRDDYWASLLTSIFQGPIHALAFSPNGKFLASGATDGRVLLWDIGHGLMVGELKGHTDTIYSLRFSRDGEILASGGWPTASRNFTSVQYLLTWTVKLNMLYIGFNVFSQIWGVSAFNSRWPCFIFFFSPGSMDNTVRLWDAMKAFDDLETDDFTAATGHVHLQDNSQELLLGTYMSKSTPVVHLHFTRRNLLLAAGAYNPWDIVELWKTWIEANLWALSATVTEEVFWCSGNETKLYYQQIASGEHLAVNEDKKLLLWPSAWQIQVPNQAYLLQMSPRLRKVPLLIEDRFLKSLPWVQLCSTPGWHFFMIVFLYWCTL